MNNQQIIGGQNPNGQIPQNLNVDISQSEAMDCENCGGIFFKESIMIRRVSKLLIGGPKDAIIPVPIMRCEDCGEVLKDLAPKGIPEFE